MTETNKTLPQPKPVNVEKFSDWLNDGHDKPMLRMATKLAQRIANPNVLGFVQYYLSLDEAQRTTEQLAGQIYWLYFKASKEIQREFITALCTAKEITPPEDDRTARQQLVTALYGDDPDAIEDGGGKYDSKGGKRITAAIRTFETRMGIYQKERKTRKRERVPRRTKEFLLKVYEVGKAG